MGSVPPGCRARPGSGRLAPRGPVALSARATASRTGSGRLTRQQRGVLVAAGAANALIFLDQTAVTVALPAIQRDLGATTVAVHWTIGAYLLSLASLMPAAGRLADRYGRRRLFLAGVATFGVASVACAAAPSDLALIVARVVQGVGAALTQPLVLAQATAIMPAERRGWTIGLIAAAGSSFLMIGPLLGGVLVETAGWRWVFLVNVPIVLLAVGLGLRFMPETKDPEAPALDRAGLVLLSAGLAATVAGLLHMKQWSTGAGVGTVAAGLLLLTGFVAVERRVAHPLLPLRLLRRPEVAASMAALVAIQGAVLGVTVYVVLYLQNGLGLSALEAGAVLLPAMLWTPLLSTSTGRLADRVGERLPVGLGLLLAAAGLTGLAFLALGDEALLLLPGLLVFGVSRPFIFTPASTGPIKVLPPGERGLASALVTESRQLGAVLGVAVLGAIAAAAESGAGTGASASGLEAGLLLLAGVAAGTGVLALARL
jgi:DHA2 family methylenomycin A resistance protein-like MFS transporter